MWYWEYRSSVCRPGTSDWNSWVEGGTLASIVRECSGNHANIQRVRWED